MVCLACKRSTETDCFIDALDTIKQHYLFYKNALSSRDAELQSVKERNERLNKALEFLQKQQEQPHKKFKANSNDDPLIRQTQFKPPKVCNNSDNSLDISIDEDTDDGVESEGSASNLNMALNSEQLFETSVVSPAKPAAIEPLKSSSEIITSPRAKLVPRRNRQKENIKDAMEKQMVLEKSKSECNLKEQQANKSWTMAFLKPSTTVAVSSKSTDGKVGVTRKPDKRMNLSLKKTNPSKIRQTVLPFNTSKDSSVIESDVCEDIIDASPIASKSSRNGKSWAHRSQQNQSSHNSSSPIPRHNNSNNNKTDINIEDSNNHQKPDETVESIPIENIVFDFSPSKKTEASFSTSSCQNNNLKAKQLDFHDESTNCLGVAGDQTTMLMSGKSGDSSSVVILTPATQDIIFLDDTSNEFSDINTMDLLADIQKHETEYMENLKKYETKSIEKQLKQDTKQPAKSKEATKHNFIKPAALIKKEKQSQMLEETQKKTVIENENLQASTSSSKKSTFQNPLLSNDDTSEDEDEDAMPKPIIVKQEPCDMVVTHKKLNLKERFNIDCEECEKHLRFLPPTLSDREIEMHLNNCKFHNRLDFMRQNTPENFWNPLILSFEANDPRNEVLIDTRFKNKKGN
ncbi:J domain-containing protein DDB_G0295729 [Musca domestica]|uniref:J domain-containing protein DDB_G0295729 n=1 Tax=Musca domestica TaxID=7370 RepID=A0A9J7CYX3_MUSDO|nr:J domain-containing protein DDB_G0295729 [Musca domestica]